MSRLLTSIHRGFPSGGSLSSASDVSIDTTSTTVTTYTVSIKQNVVIGLYFIVENATTNLTINVSWTDSNGIQSLNILNNVPEVIGSYAVNNFLINCQSDTSITVTMTASISGNILGSASIISG